MNQSTIPNLGEEWVLPDNPGNTSRGDLRNRVILITGAASGLGRAAARALSAEGATTILLDRNLKALESLYDEITGASGEEPLLHPINFEGVGAAEYLELATAVDQQFGRLDGVLHSAVALGELSPLHQYDPDLWARTLHVNINAPFMLNQVCLPLLQRSDSSRLVFTSDAVGRRGRAFWGAYGISKAALENMMEILANELGAGSRVRVMTFDPGTVETPLRRRAYPTEQDGTHPSPDDLARCYLRLFGTEGASLHGRRVTRPANLGEQEHNL